MNYFIYKVNFNEYFILIHACLLDTLFTFGNILADIAVRISLFIVMFVLISFHTFVSDSVTC